MSSAHEDVQKLAYRLWQERGCPPDSPDADWYRAEQELSQGSSEEHAAPDGDETLARPPAPPTRARAGSGTRARQRAEHNA